MRGPIRVNSAGMITVRTTKVSSRMPRPTMIPSWVSEISGSTPSTANTAASTMPALVITREDIKSWRYNTSSRNAAGGVLAKSHNAKTGKTEEVLVPDPDNPLAPIRTVRHTASGKGTAGSKAKATLDAARRSTATLSFTLPGRADIVAERVASITGLKPGVDGQWPIESVAHAFSQSGWETSVECGAGKDQHKKRAGKKTGKKKEQMITHNLMIW